MLANYLGGVLYCAVTISCGSDTVTDPVMGQIITLLPHDITQLLTSPYLYCNHSICCPCHCLHFCCRCCCHYVVPFVVLLLFPPLEMQSTPQRLRTYCCVHWKWGAQIFICFGSHDNSSGSCWVHYWFSWVADGQMMFGSLLDQGIAHPWLLYHLWRCWKGWRCFVNAANIDDVVSAAGYIY